MITVSLCKTLKAKSPSGRLFGAPHRNAQHHESSLFRQIIIENEAVQALTNTSYVILRIHIESIYYKHLTVAIQLKLQFPEKYGNIFSSDNQGE